MRYFTLDALRGFALINMVAYHFCYDLRYLYGLPLRFMDERSGFCWQQMICWTFILVSGASAALSRRPARRGMAVLGCGMLLTVVTFLIMPGQRIVFGVLHLLGCAMLLTAGLLPLLQRLSPAAGAAGSFLLFLGTRWFPPGFFLGCVFSNRGWFPPTFLRRWGSTAWAFFLRTIFRLSPGTFFF